MLDYSKVEKFPDVIPWDVYMKVMAKIHWQKKACFRDFIKAGRNFKFALYRLLNRMFLKEEFPKVSTEAQALIAFNASAFKLKTVWGDFHKVQSLLLQGEVGGHVHVQQGLPAVGQIPCGS